MVKRAQLHQPPQIQCGSISAPLQRPCLGRETSAPLGLTSVTAPYPKYLQSMLFTAHRIVSSPLTRPLVLALVVAALWTSPARADDYAEVNRLVRAGLTSEALNRADQYLLTKPRDPQMRFLKGVILTETGKSTDAISVFVKLTEEYPELPEPYNNLAVLYASLNQFDKARAALEMAIRTNPSYATAHENLGDVYAKLASQSYSKALQLDGSNAAVPPKLALIRTLFGQDARAPRPVAPQVTAVTPRPTQPAPVAPALTPAATPAPKPTTAPVAPSVSAMGQDEAIAAVQAWAKAWSSRDMPNYLGAYDARFKPPGGKSRKSWEKERHSRIIPRPNISVEVSDFKVTPVGDQLSVEFHQSYKAGAIVSTTQKTLDLAKVGGRWLITSESTGN